MKKWIALYLFIALFAPLLANEKPLYISIGGQTYFPALTGQSYLSLDGKSEPVMISSKQWRLLPADAIIFPPVPYSPQMIDPDHSDYVSPFDDQLAGLKYRHWLGTNKLGQDVLSGIIHGTRTAVLVGFFSMLIALIIGIPLGILSGYFGESGWKVSRLQFYLFLLLIIPAFFYASKISSHILVQVLVALLIVCSPALIPSYGRSVAIPVDRLSSSAIEIFLSLPRLLLLLVIASVTGPSLTMLILIIGLTSWTEIARILRIEVIKVKGMDYYTAAVTTGISPFRLWTKHLLPNVMTPVWPIISYGMAAAVLVEAGLSFIGAGTSPDTPSWGKMMFDARQNYQAWWMVIFPGTALFGLLYNLRKRDTGKKNLILPEAVSLNKF